MKVGERQIEVLTPNQQYLTSVIHRVRIGLLPYFLFLGLYLTYILEWGIILSSKSVLLASICSINQLLLADVHYCPPQPHSYYVYVVTWP